MMDHFKVERFTNGDCKWRCQGWTAQTYQHKNGYTYRSSYFLAAHFRTKDEARAWLTEQRKQYSDLLKGSGK